MTHHALTVTKVILAFAPGTLMLAAGVEGVATNPLTIPDIALMLSGLVLVWFGKEMVKTLRSVDNILPRLLSLEAERDARVQVVLLANEMRTAKEKAIP
jgi:hypothetical protein